MNPTEIEFAVRDLVAKPYDSESFPFDLIGIYNAPKSTVTKLKSGQTNSAKQPGDVLWKKHLFFRAINSGDDVASAADAILEDPLTAKYKPRFVLVTDGVLVHIRDLRLDDTCNAEFERLDETSDFLLPLAGFERRAAVEEHPADIKAAKRLKKLYDAILVANPTWNSTTHTHELNVFMTRVLFCLYAEDTGIFDTPKLFRNTVTQHTQEDGTNVAPFLDRIFRIMNVEESKRPKDTPSVELKFPYVNGSLFENTLEVPKFNRTLRRLLLECAELDWTTINPDIFGSMIQTVAEAGTRGDLGMHYTSVPNIMKALQPLFLDDLNETYEKAADSASKLEALLSRLSRIRVFDPACGSGNFLIIAYKQLRELEIRTLRRMAEIAPNTPLRLSGVSLQNFFGIDVVDFACETAKLSLWIAEHQMNTAFKENFGTARPTLPLGKIATVHNGNALRLDWLNICPVNQDAETYICGNPPYKGSKWQSDEQKDDLARVFTSATKTYKDLDYVSGWFYKTTLYIEASPDATRGALVATNSISQGNQVALLWPLLLDRGIRIAFAHRSFKWVNSASNNAFIFCVIVGLTKADSHDRTLIYDDHVVRVQNINPYLVPSRENNIVFKTPSPLNGLPEMMFGNMPRDGGHLILSPDERAKLIADYPESVDFVRRMYGSQEFIQGIERYCLWITDSSSNVALSIPPIKKRVDAVAEFRRSSDAPSTRQAANSPHRFVQIQGGGKPAVIVPAVFSEKRQYPTIGVVNEHAVVSNLAYAIYGSPAYMLSLLSSRLHWLWTHTIAGRHGMVIGYSNTIVYNNFPVPSLSLEQQQSLSGHSRAILMARAKYPEKTIEWLYDPATMPNNLLQAHHESDNYIEEHIFGRKFSDDTQRLEYLFAMYTRMREHPTRDNSLFSLSEKKNR